MLVNFTNHPSNKWGKEQIAEAEQSFGHIVDLPFPSVPTDADTKQISELADEQIHKIAELLSNRKETANAVLCQGEFTLAFAVIARLLSRGAMVISAVSDRVVSETQMEGETHKDVVFRFAGFRAYIF